MRDTSRIILTAWLCAACLTPPAAHGEAASVTPVRGMTISCPRAGQIWGTDAMVETMAILKDMGVNWIAIHPYGGIRRDGTVGRSGIDGLYRNPIWLTRAIREAHNLGLKIMIKPHIAYWGTGFAWRGEIQFETEAEWRHFFSTYEEWITKVADLSADADAFVVGTELDQTVHRDAEWRQVIAAVRARTGAPLTYSANWDSFERVPFWDAMDVIGVQSYFPLLDREGLASQQELDDAWGDLAIRLEDYARRHDRMILLGELGYNRTLKSAYQPWTYGRDSAPDAEELQSRCLRAALKTVAGSDKIVGAFLWKWFPGEIQRGDFIKSSPAMRRVITDHWSAGPTLN